MRERMVAEIVAYLGPPASYTHQAAHSAFPDQSYTLNPYTTIADVFTAVQSGEAQHGVVPFENSTYGPVVATFDLLATTLKNKIDDTKVGGTQPRIYSDIHACRDVFVQVQHCLLGRDVTEVRKDSTTSLNNGSESSLTATTTTTEANDALPSISHITLVQSHEQALGQCKIFLSTDLKHATKKDVSSTSRAAELAAADPTGATASISSEMAAGLYGLKVLRKGIQDRDDNVTRFLVLEPGVVSSDKGVVNSQSQTTNGSTTAGSQHKALIIFTVSHTSPGALADSLAVFKKHGVNVTSINTRPSGVAPWHYYFFVEIIGQDIEGALSELGIVAESWRCLGGWVC